MPARLNSLHFILFHRHVFQGRSDVVKILLDSGADPVVKNIHNSNALGMAETNLKNKKDKESARLIAERLLHNAIGKADLPAAMEAIATGHVDCNYASPTGGRWNALILATSKQDIKAVEQLLSKGANPNVAEADGWYPLMFATNAGNVKLMEVLLKEGADVNTKLRDGRDCLRLAQDWKKPQAVVDTLLRFKNAVEAAGDPARMVIPNEVEVAPDDATMARLARMQEEEQRRLSEQKRVQEQKTQAAKASAAAAEAKRTASSSSGSASSKQSSAASASSGGSGGNSKIKQPQQHSSAAAPEQPHKSGPRLTGHQQQQNRAPVEPRYDPHLEDVIHLPPETEEKGLLGRILEFIGF
jgi:hypothetical protein